MELQSDYQLSSIKKTDETKYDNSQNWIILIDNVYYNQIVNT